MPGVRVVIQINRPDGVDGMLQGMVERCQKVEAEESGCLQYEVFRSAMNPNKLVLLEHWSSSEIYDKHWALAQANRPAAPPPAAADAPAAPARPSSDAEFYQQTYYEVVDGVWAPRDPQERSQSIRWA